MMNRLKSRTITKSSIKSKLLRGSIRRQLLSYIIAGVIALLLAFSAVIISLTTKQTEARLEHNAKQVTIALAQNTILALLTASIDNAKTAMEQVLSFPDVDGAGLVSSDGTFRVWRGNANTGSYFENMPWKQITDDTILFEDNNHIYVGSVILLEDADINEVGEPVDERLGYAVVSFSKRNLEEINHNIIVSISFTGVIAVIGLILIIGSAIKKQLAPLKELTQIMVYNHETGEHNLAHVSGSIEVEKMAASFNAMMRTLDDQDEKLRHHRDQLEAEVKIRTRELVEARDAAMSSNRQKSEFLANMTHELRTPIQSIVGYVDLVKEEVENEGAFHVAEDLDKVTRNAERLLGMINSVLDLSKVEAGKMELNINNTYLSDLLRDVEEATAPLVPTNRNHFYLLSHCENMLLQIDSEKLLQVLINLISNACKFTEDGTITLDIKLKGEVLQFSVSDTGIGIEETQLSKIFNEFIQVDAGENRKFGGTGLGLAISKQFCELMQAEISVASRYGEGTTFTVTLPI